MEYNREQLEYSRKENETATDYATRYLREETMNFNIRPDSSINEKEIALKLGTSRAPIREALSRLISEDLVTFIPGKGFFCRQLSIDEVRELFEVRQELEIASIKSAIKNATDEEIKKLYENSIEYQKIQETIEKKQLVIVDENFHYELNKIGGNNERLKFIANINKRIRFVRQISLETLDTRNKFIEEHIELIKAIYERKEEKAIKIMKSHLRANSEDLTENIKNGLAKIYGFN